MKNDIDARIKISSVSVGQMVVPFLDACEAGRDEAWALIYRIRKSVEAAQRHWREMERPDYSGRFVMNVMCEQKPYPDGYINAKAFLSMASVATELELSHSDLLFLQGLNPNDMTVKLHHLKLIAEKSEKDELMYAALSEASHDEYKREMKDRINEALRRGLKPEPPKPEQMAPWGWAVIAVMVLCAVIALALKS